MHWENEMRIFTQGSCLVAAMVCGQQAIADMVQVKTPAPVIHLADNLDEADGLGWCIDTVGRGFADTLHAHSCKPQGGDVQFAFEVASGAIRSAAFEGKCMQVSAPGATTVFSLLDCDATVSAQIFTFDKYSGTIRPQDAPHTCVAVGAESRSAGPFMSRDLILAPCDDVSESHRRWVIVP